MINIYKFLGLRRASEKGAAKAKKGSRIDLIFLRGEGAHMLVLDRSNVPIL